MRILGLHDGQTSGAALLEDGRIVAAVNEERLVRIKQARGFPRASIAKVLELAGVTPEDVDAIAVSQLNMSFSDEVLPWKGWFQERGTADDLHSRFFRVAGRFAPLADRIPVLKRLYYGLRAPHYARRRRTIRRILREEFGLTSPVEFYHHHLTHAMAAYYASGFGDALVVTMDGGGDSDSSHVYSVRDGAWERLTNVDSYDSLGNYYAYVTALCGFKAKKHEGKITGLAAYGSPIFRELFDRLIGFENGKTVNRGRVLFEGALEKLRSELPEDWKKEDLASTVQTVAEELVSRHVAYWLERTGHENVALAGGVFANVRINQEVHRVPGVENVFVFPGMTDEGLSVGAAYTMIANQASSATRPVPDRRGRLPDVYLGPEFSEEQMESALREAGVEYGRPDSIADAVADRLASGAVVARFSGRMEFGPRALGNRSILYQPTDPTVQDWLNELLHRTEFMPFAPSVLLEETDRCFLDTAGALDTARFMTITFGCTDWMAENCRAAVHVDGTARPQLVDRDEAPSYWAVIDAYRKRTGLPVIINTSFNMHEEPIVCTPEDAVRAFEASQLDYLAIGPFLAKGKVGTQPVRERYRSQNREPVSDVAAAS